MKYCQNCGKQIADGASFCNYCGAKQAAVSGAPHINIPVPPIPTPAVPVIKKERDANGLGIAGFILSIISFILSWIPAINIIAIIIGALGLILSFVGLIVGIVARKRLGLAITGLILSIFAIAIGILVVIGIANL